MKPTLTIDLKDTIYRLSYVTATPVKDVGEQLCIDVMCNRKLLDRLSKHFKRDIKIFNTMYYGSHVNEQLPKRLPGPTDKITIRFKQKHYDFIYDLAYALSVSPSRVVAVLLQLALSDLVTVNRYVVRHLEKELHANQIIELKKVMRFVNQKNTTNYSSWLSLLSAITDYTGGPVTRLKEMITEFLKNDVQ